MRYNFRAYFPCSRYRLFFSMWCVADVYVNGNGYCIALAVERTYNLDLCILFHDTQDKGVNHPCSCIPRNLPRTHTTDKTT